MAKAAKLTLTVTFDDGSINEATLPLTSSHNSGALVVDIDGSAVARAQIVDSANTGERREYNRDQPVALDDRDPGNTDPEEMTAPLDPDDDIYAVVNQAPSA